MNAVVLSCFAVFICLGEQVKSGSLRNRDDVGDSDKSFSAVFADGILNILSNIGETHAEFKSIGSNTIENKLRKKRCTDESVKTFKINWEDCIDLTANIANAEKLGREWTDYRNSIEKVGHDIYWNLTQCKITTPVQQVSCLVLSLKNSTPDYVEALDKATDLLNRTDYLVQDIQSEFLGCFKSIFVHLDAGKQCQEGTTLSTFINDNEDPVKFENLLNFKIFD